MNEDIYDMYISGISPSTIAAILDCSIQTVLEVLESQQEELLLD
jgi:DNA-binding CsgD family transcriptional regulator